MSKFAIALTVVLVPIVAVLFAVGFNTKLYGTPLWVGNVWIGGCIYWAAAIVALIPLAIMHKGAIAKGVGIGVAIGLPLLVLAALLQT